MYGHGYMCAFGCAFGCACDVYKSDPAYHATSRVDGSKQGLCPSVCLAWLARAMKTNSLVFPCVHL